MKSLLVDSQTDLPHFSSESFTVATNRPVVSSCVRKEVSSLGMGGTSIIVHWKPSGDVAG